MEWDSPGGSDDGAWTRMCIVPPGPRLALLGLISRSSGDAPGVSARGAPPAEAVEHLGALARPELGRIILCPRLKTSARRGPWGRQRAQYSPDRD